MYQKYRRDLLLGGVVAPQPQEGPRARCRWSWVGSDRPVWGEGHIRLSTQPWDRGWFPNPPWTQVLEPLVGKGSWICAWIQALELRIVRGSMRWSGSSLQHLRPANTPGLSDGQDFDPVPFWSLLIPFNHQSITHSCSYPLGNHFS